MPNQLEATRGHVKFPSKQVYLEILRVKLKKKKKELKLILYIISTTNLIVSIVKFQNSF